MKVIMLEDVRKVGKKDEIIEVSNGYANNFLLKNKLAVPYTKKSKEVLDTELEEKRKQEEEKIKKAERIKQELEKKTIEFKVKTGAKDKIFGKISTKQIADELKKMGYSIDKKCLKLYYDITSLGVSEVEVILHKKVKFKLKIQISK